MIRVSILAFVLSACAATSAPSSEMMRDLEAARTEDLRAAMSLFERNIQAIQDKDRDSYLACYRQSADLLRMGNGGPHLGFEDFASSTSSVASDWPERLEASELTVVPVAPGVVFGFYKYHVTIKGVTTEGWSERVFVKDKEGWRVAVSTAFQNPPSEDR